MASILVRGLDKGAAIHPSPRDSGPPHGTWQSPDPTAAGFASTQPVARLS
jgi:hypothetical protein